MEYREFGTSSGVITSGTVSIYNLASSEHSLGLGQITSTDSIKKIIKHGDDECMNDSNKIKAVVEVITVFEENGQLVHNTMFFDEVSGYNASKRMVQINEKQLRDVIYLKINDNVRFSYDAVLEKIDTREEYVKKELEIREIQLKYSAGLITDVEYKKANAEIEERYGNKKLTPYIRYEIKFV